MKRKSCFALVIAMAGCAGRYANSPDFHPVGHALPSLPGDPVKKIEAVLPDHMQIVQVQTGFYTQSIVRTRVAHKSGSCVILSSSTSPRAQTSKYISWTRPMMMAALGSTLMTIKLGHRSSSYRIPSGRFTFTAET